MRAVLFLALFVTLGGATKEPQLKLNATCKRDNVTGICKNKDACKTNLTSVKLEPCNEGDLSLVCCPIGGINNRPKRTPGEKAREMCRIYGKTAYKTIPSPVLGLGSNPIQEMVCDVKREPLKIGRSSAKKKEFPHVARLTFFEEESETFVWQGSGSVISPEFILSIPHHRVTKENGYAMVGAIKMDHTSEFFDKHVIAISDVFIHPDYNPANNTNSIALFKLSTSLNRSERPICLDAGSPISNNMKALATGFGFNKDGTSTDVLQKVIMNTVDQGSCVKKYKQFRIGISSENMFCAYSEEGTCGVDSGGPLQIYHGQLPCMYTLIGITSFGPNCSLGTNIPDVYTKVSPYVGWIEDIVWPA